MEADTASIPAHCDTLQSWLPAATSTVPMPGRPPPNRALTWQYSLERSKVRLGGGCIALSLQGNDAGELDGRCSCRNGTAGRVGSWHGVEYFHFFA